MIELVAASKPDGLLDSTWGETLAALRWMLVLASRVGFTIDDNFGLEDQVFVRTAYEAAPTVSRDRMRRAWPKVVEVLKRKFDLTVPEPNYGERSGRPPYYTPELFDAARVMQIVGINPTRLCKLRWGDVRFDPDLNQIFFRTGPYDEEPVDASPPVRAAWETIRKWSASKHKKSPDKLEAEYFVIPHSSSYRLPASPSAFYTALKRYAPNDSIPAHHTGKYFEPKDADGNALRSKPKPFSWGSEVPAEDGKAD